MIQTAIATVGLVIWMVLWAVGVKAFDGFMITILLLIVGSMLTIILPALPGNRRDPLD